MNIRQRALIALIVVFLIGCTVGAGSVYLWLSKARAGDNWRGGHKSGHFKLHEMLQLSSEQDVQFKKIMAESRGQFEVCRAETEPKFQAIRSEMRRKIFAILNEEQKKKFEAFLKQMDARKKERDFTR